ncbi:UDP-glycosyltransferase 85C1-like protein [Tanacetum coccineum]
MVDGGSLALPTELEEGIKRRGFIASWCSQEEVLGYPSIFGFLTHGGWGSVIESLSTGVPMLCWAVSQDQRINCIQMCKECEVRMKIGKKVNRHEVEKLVRELMDGIKGKRLRKKAMECKTKAEIVTAPNGSSTMNIQELVHEITMLSRN